MRILALLGKIPAEVRILPPPRDRAGYCQGTCTLPEGATVGEQAVVFAAGVLDGHGAADDEANLAAVCADEVQREEVLRLAARTMRHPQFALVRNRVARRLQFHDVLAERELRQIINDAQPASS